MVVLRTVASHIERSGGALRAPLAGHALAATLVLMGMSPACSLVRSPIDPGARDTSVGRTDVPGLDAPTSDVLGMDAPGVDAPGLDAPLDLGMPWAEMDVPRPPDVPPPEPDVPVATPDVPPPRPDAGRPAASVACGAVTCTAPQVCCVDFSGPRGCASRGGCALAGEASCDGPEDCVGPDACCVSGFRASCTPSAGCGIRVCHTTADCPTGVCCPVIGMSGVCRTAC